MQSNKLYILYFYCIGYTDNDWSTSVLRMDRYQEELKIRMLSDWEELGLSNKIQEFYQEQLQKEIKEKEQIQQVLQQERNEQAQEKASLIQKFNKDTAHLKKTNATLEAQIVLFQKELQEGRRLTSRLMKQKREEVKMDTVISEKDDVKSFEQQLNQFIIPQSGMCVCAVTGIIYDVSILFQIS